MSVVENRKIEIEARPQEIALIYFTPFCTMFFNVQKLDCGFAITVWLIMLKNVVQKRVTDNGYLLGEELFIYKLAINA